MIRRALQAQYDEMARAIIGKDVDRVLRLFSPLDTATEDGRAWWVDAFQRTRSFDAMSITLDSLVLLGDTARVGYTEHSEFTLATAGVPRHGEVTQHEVAWWVRSPGAWLHQSFVRDGYPHRFIDGVAQPVRRADSVRVEVARRERRRRAWPGEPGFGLTAPIADTGRFLSLYERITARSIREPSVFARHPLSPEERASVAWLVGAWTCPARIFATPTTPARAGQNPEHSVYELDAEGALNVLSVDSTSGRPIAYRSPRLFRDARAGVWVLHIVESAGWGILTAPAWRGDTITFTGRTVIMGSPTDLRQTWTRTGNDTYTIYNEEVAPDGTRVPLDEYACTRDASRP